MTLHELAILFSKQHILLNWVNSLVMVQRVLCSIFMVSVLVIMACFTP